MATDALGNFQRTGAAALPMARGAMPLLSAMVFIVSLGYGAGLPLIRPYLLRYLGAVPTSTVAWHVGMLGGVYLFALFPLGFQVLNNCLGGGVVMGMVDMTMSAVVVALCTVRTKR